MFSLIFLQINTILEALPRRTVYIVAHLVRHGVNDRTWRIIIVTRRIAVIRVGLPRIRALIIFITRRPRSQLTRNSVLRIK